MILERNYRCRTGEIDVVARDTLPGHLDAEVAIVALRALAAQALSRTLG